MSGIAGALSLTRSRVDGAVVERMLDAIQHRGPDDSGLYRSTNGKAALGNRRLAIIDLRAEAAPPLSNERRDVWLAFNGEIYNHRPLRHSLELEGHVFRTNSDAEAVVHAYEQYGLEFLSHLQGMFAIALWDDRAHRLILARDRLGEKPLYYLRAGGLLLFASEIKALLAASAAPRRLDVRALGQYLSFGFVPPPLTLFEDVMKLAAGEAMVVERGTTKRIQWWQPLQDPRKTAAIQAIPLERHVDNVRTILECTVADRLAADAPIGGFLNGTLASACMVTAMARLTGRPMQTITAVFPDAPESDAGAFCRAVAAAADAHHHEVVVTQARVIQALPDIVRHMDEPIADPACVTDWMMAKHCADHGITVTLNEEGAEQIFIGSWRPEPGGLYRRLLRPLRTLFGRPRQSCDADGHPCFADYEKLALLGAALRDIPGEPSMPGILGRVRKDLPEWLLEDSLALSTWQETLLRLPEQKLMRVDKMTMAHGIEARMPYADHQFVNYVLSLPGAVRAPGGQAGYLLNRVAADMVPDAALRRPRAPLKEPTERWFAEDLGRLFESKMEHSALFRDGIIDADHCKVMLRAHRHGSPHHGRLWAILVLATWYDGFQVNVPPSAEPARPAEVT